MPDASVQAIERDPSLWDKPEIWIPVLAALIAILFGGRGLLDLLLSLFKRKTPKPAESPTYTINRDLVSLPPRGEHTPRSALAAEIDRAFGSANLCILLGNKGAGKTIAAIQAAYRQVDQHHGRKPAAFVMVRCSTGGFDLGNFCDSLCAQLDYPAAVGAGMPTKTALTTAFFARAQFETYCVVDNFEACGAEQRVIFEFLQSLPRGVHMLVTTTEGHAWMAPATQIRVEGMREAESIAFLRHQIEAKGLSQLASAPEAELARLHRATGGNPLAMQWALGEAASVSSLDQVLRRLEIGVLESINQELFGAAWEKASVDERGVLHMLATMPSPVSLGVLGAALNADEKALLRRCIRLDALGLVEQTQAGGSRLGPALGLHPLVRVYVMEKSEPDDGSDLIRMGKGLLGLLKGQDEKLPLSLSASEVRREYENIRHVLDGLSSDQIELKAALVVATHEAMNLLGQYDDRIRFCQEIGAYFTQNRDQLSASAMEYVVAGTYNNKSDPERGRAHAIRALKLAEEAGDNASIARAQRVKGLAEYLMALDVDAAASVATALATARTANDKECEVEALFVDANLKLAKGDTSGAQSALKQFVDVASAIGWKRSTGYAQCMLARVELDAGNTEEAAAKIAVARQVADEFSDARLQGRVALLESALAFKRANAREALNIAKGNLEFVSRLGLHREAQEASSQIAYWSNWPRRTFAWLFAGQHDARYSQVRIAGV